MSREEFFVDALRTEEHSESESDSEIPQFVLPAFDKYKGITESKDGLSSLYVSVNPNLESSEDRMNHQKQILKEALDECNKMNLVAKPGFETLEHVPTFLSRRQRKKLGMKEKEKTKGFHWYNMAAPEITEEKKNDLTVVQMRQALDPKHFYKRSLSKTQPKYFQVGTYVESPVDFYSSRVPKKERKRTLVEELMADNDFCMYQKKKMGEAILAHPKRQRTSKKPKNKGGKAKKPPSKKKKK